jgi:hypothetical protein
MIAEQPDGNFLQGPGGRGNLGDDIGAPGIGLGHFLQAADLAFYLAQPPQVIILARGVTAGASPGGTGPRRAALISELGIWPGLRGQGGHGTA